jgi:GT2 family glycosyltransferase
MKPGVGRPIFSVVTPVFRTSADHLEECIASVERQTFADFEMLLVDDGNAAELARWLRDRCRRDPRLTVITSPANLGIARASQLGVDAAQGEFLALLDHDDTLSPVALETVADHLSDELDYLYSDEDKINDKGEYVDPSFKPDWSPERFRHHMYTCHLSVLRTALVREVGGFRSGYDGSQDYDLVLRVTEKARRVVHIPEVLYHWRAHAGSTASVIDQKPAAFEAGRRAVEEHCERTGIAADVMDGPAGALRVKRHIRGAPLVSLVIPTYGKTTELAGSQTTLVEHFVRSVERLSTYRNYEYVVVGDTRMSEEAVLGVLAACGDHPVSYVDYEQPSTGFNFSEKVNVGATRASGEYVVVLNDDLEVITPDWLEVLLGTAQDPGVGAVGGMYYFEDDTIQHAGVMTVLGAYHLFYRGVRGQQVFGHHLAVARETSVLTGACLMVRKSYFMRVGGFTEALPNNFNDVDFCLKLRTSGLRNIWTPHVELYHFESQSREQRVHAFEHELLLRRWGTRLMRDPYYNPNLVRTPAYWAPADDWDLISRGWPEIVLNVRDVDPEGYLEVNPDLSEALARDASFDLRRHLEAFGRAEGRAYVPRRQRPSIDRNLRALVRATSINFNVDGYLDANPDLRAYATRDPGWDPLRHLLDHGEAEGRYLYVDADRGTPAPHSPA